MKSTQTENYYGFGLGLRTPHYQNFQQEKQNVDWLEIISDNFLIAGGKPLQHLEKFRSDYPIAMHGVAMSIGSSEGLDFNYLTKLKNLAKWLEPMWLSDHLCWGGLQQQPLHDLYPLPYTEECANLIISHITTAQDFLERKLVIENVSSYLRYRSSSVTEWEFLNYIANEADCDLLLDVNNIYVSSVNHGFDTLDYLNAIPVSRVRQIHLAGHSYSEQFIIDTHDHPIIPAVWDLYAKACQRFGNVATMIERDDNIPPLEELITELNLAREIAKDNCFIYQNNQTNQQNISNNQQLKQTIKIANNLFSDKNNINDKLHNCQKHIVNYILSAKNENDQIVAEVEQDENTLKGISKSSDVKDKISSKRGLEIYHNAYRIRLQDVLRDCYAKLTAYIEIDYWQYLLDEYVEKFPPLSRQLGEYGAEMANFLREKGDEHFILYELASLEWAMRRAFDSKDSQTWDVNKIDSIGAEKCFNQFPILFPQIKFLNFSSNVLDIWQAIHDDKEVPEAQILSNYQIIVWRKDYRPHFRKLGEFEQRFLNSLQFQSIQATVDNWLARDLFTDANQLGAWLYEWWEQGILFYPD